MAEKNALFDAIKIALPLSVLAAGPIFLLLFLAIAAGSTLTAGGATTPQTINAAPDSPLKALFVDYELYTDPAAYLKANTGVLEQQSAKLQAWDAKLVAGEPYKSATGATISGENVTKIKAVIQEMIAQLKQLSAVVSSGKPADGEKYRIGLANNWTKLARLAQSADSTALARAAASIIQYNNDGKGPISYSRDPNLRLVVKNTEGVPIYQDCSAFITYSLQKAGIFTATEIASTLDLSTKYNTDKRFIVVASAIGGAISTEDAKAKIQPGDILISSNGNITQGFNEDTNENHAVIYLGPNPLGDGTVVGGDVANSYRVIQDKKVVKSGPMYTSLDARLRIGHIQMILRPSGLDS